MKQPLPAGQHALTPCEAFYTLHSPNLFEDIGTKALLGGLYLFIDAQAPKIIRVERRKF